MITLEDELKLDTHKLNYHPGRVDLWLKGDKIFPIYLELGITSACNHRCIFCALDFTGYKGKFIDTKVMLDALTDMASHGIRSIMFGGEGEPTLHKDFSLFVEHAKKHGMDVALTTNGVLFTKSIAEKTLPHMSWVKFSVDAATPETYAKIHGTKEADLGKLMQNIKDAAEIKRKNNLKVKIGTQVLLINDNSSEVVMLAEKVREAGADYLVVKPYSQHPLSSKRFKLDYDNLKSLKPKVEATSTKDFKAVFRLDTMEKLKSEAPYEKCYGLPFFALIDAEGNIIPCNLFYDNKEFYYGNLYDNSFSEIWLGKKREEVIRKLDCKGTKECRENCRLDPINRYLHSLKNPPEHVNFI